MSPLSNTTSLICATTHLTSFGGSFAVPTNKIDLSNSAFTKLNENPLVFSVMISCMCLYLVLLIWAKREDKEDEIKVLKSLIASKFGDAIKLYTIVLFELFIFPFPTGPEQLQCWIMTQGTNICTRLWFSLAPGKGLVCVNMEDFFCDILPFKWHYQTKFGNKPESN